jgi:hypothetical protein
MDYKDVKVVVDGDYFLFDKVMDSVVEKVIKDYEQGRVFVLVKKEYAQLVTYRFNPNNVIAVSVKEHGPSPPSSLNM